LKAPPRIALDTALGADDLERELLELATAGPGIGGVGVHADIKGDIIDLGGPGQQVGRGFEVEAGVSLDQRGELEVLLAVGWIKQEGLAEGIARGRAEALIAMRAVSRWTPQIANGSSTSEIRRRSRGGSRSPQPVRTLLRCLQNQRDGSWCHANPDENSPPVPSARRRTRGDRAGELEQLKLEAQKHGLPSR